MKKIKKLKLIQLSKDSLDAKRKSALMGGNSDVCWVTCTVCQCSSWDGTGIMPPSQSSSDLGVGYVSGFAKASLQSYVY
jgi:natural product precursor